MEKLEQSQAFDAQSACCFFGAVRGFKENGELLAVVTDIYSESIEISHKTFECKILSGLKPLESQKISFADPEVWRLESKDKMFAKRGEVIKGLEEEKRTIIQMDVLDKDC